jgi:NAD(P)H-dependent flavin oxidoreductase YrpB (nitropropane dioxygenase family)
MKHATAFAESLGLRFPIFQAPVGSVAGPELAAAVSQAGGMGALALTWTSPDDTRRLITQVRTQTEKPFQTNFVLAFPSKSLAAALEAGVRVVTFSWGSPSHEVPLLKSFGARFGVQATTAEGARRALALGADFLICQGIEAGGHVQATRSLDEILPEIIEAAQGTPVVAAGGIGDGKAIARVLAMGASGAMLGTRFVATRESLAHEIYKRRLVEARAQDTALTVCFDGGWPYAAQRVLRNSTLEHWEAAGCPPAGRRPGEGDRLASEPGGREFLRYDDTPPRATMQGDPEAMCLYAGTSCDEVHEILPVHELMQKLWRDCLSADRSFQSPP